MTKLLLAAVISVFSASAFSAQVADEGVYTKLKAGNRPLNTVLVATERGLLAAGYARSQTPAMVEIVPPAGRGQIGISGDRRDDYTVTVEFVGSRTEVVHLVIDGYSFFSVETPHKAGDFVKSFNVTRK